MAEFPLPDPGIDDRGLLIRFINAVQQLLLEMVETGSDPQGRYLLIEVLRPAMQQAWPELQPHFDLTITRLKETQDHQLQAHGLTGQMLRFKMAVVHQRNERYIHTGGSRLLRLLLGPINTVLKSIADALGVGGAISEFKEMIEGSIEDQT